MMDPSTVTALAQGAVALLAPHIPGLLQKGAESAAVEAGKRAFGTGWEQAKGLWGVLGPQLEAAPAAAAAVHDVAAQPESAGAQAALTWQVEKMLRADHSLSEQVAKRLQEAPSSGVNIINSSRAVGIGRDVTGSTIIMGDGNVIGDKRARRAGSS